MSINLKEPTRIRRCLLNLLWVGPLAFGATVAVAEENGGLKIVPREKWTTAFSDSQVKRHFEITAKEKFRGKFLWSYTANGRTIDAGEEAIEIAAGQSITREISLRIPAINEGVVFQTELSVSVTRAGQRDAVLTWKRSLKIFPRNPFAGRSKWLEELSISLFDPPGDTADIFQSMKISINRIHNVESLAKLEGGLLIVGEGVSFSQHRSLAKTLAELAGRGIPVLCLAPKDGTLILPFGTNAGPPPSSMLFRNREVITKLDKRLDSAEWMANADIERARIQLLPERNHVVGKFVDEAPGWAWLELQYPQDSALVYCGFGIINDWDHGPTPRYLLIRLLEHLAQESPQDVPDNNPRRTP